MFYTVYKVTNQINSKFYIGVHRTKKINDNYLGSGKLLKRALKKYGKDNFIKEILFIFDNVQGAYLKEQELVDNEIINSENSYNLKLGGEGGFEYINSNGLNGNNIASIKFKQRYNTDKEFTEQHREKGRRALLKGRKVIKERFPDGVWKNRHHNEETKQKMSSFRKGVYNKDQCWITNNGVNKKIKLKDLELWINLGWVRGRCNAFVH